jgi:tRNA nucleotidyltransferase/poly(A) polymerase
MMARGSPRPERPVFSSAETAAAVHVFTETRGFLRAERAAAYLVGGFLRDMLLGRISGDIDIAVAGADPVALALHLHERLGFSRPAVFPRFRTALTVGKGVKVEICGLQGEPAEDASRRDFTVNCLYADLRRRVGNPPDLKILDPTGRGIADLKDRLLRTPAPPCETIWLDPLRAVRAVRLGAVYGFEIDPLLRDCLPRLVYLLGRVARERLRGELERILVAPRAVWALRRMEELGISSVLFPELSRAKGYNQTTPYHDYDLFTHTLKTVAGTPRDTVLRLAALFHDLGKPAVRRMKGRRAVYYGHQEVSADLADAAMKRLGFPTRIRKRVVLLVKHHMIQYSRAWTDRAVRRFARNMGDNLGDVLVLAEADQKAQVRSARRIPARDLRKRITRLEQRREIHYEAPMDGRDIMTLLGISEGPLVGRAKARLVEEALTLDRPMSRAEAAEILMKWAKDHRVPH